MNVDVVIPALDEEPAIGDVVRSFIGRVREVVVADNGSRDRTAEVAREAGARVVSAPRRGYGNACLAALAELAPGCDVVVFADADGSDDPADLDGLVAPIVSGEADLVIGSRVRGVMEAGALTPQQRMGNALAATWLRWRFGQPATDLGPFRAVRKESLDRLHMSDPTYGWTIEMQIKAARAGMRYTEVPVAYRRRKAGTSKVSGTLRGIAGASAKILGLLAYYDVVQRSALAQRLWRRF
ncbi:MAG: glycosyltransferase family 2 protein [Myxococcota bacterium]|nr:glycosyltransferase family 2 protein [Myxococcota bacterium]